MDDKKQVEKLKKVSSVKQLAFGMISYTSASILGPLVLFCGIGYYIDYKLETKPLMIIVGILLAFFLTNVLIFKKIRVLIKEFDKIEKLENKKKTEEKST